MGRIFKKSKLTTGFEVALIGLALTAVGFGLYLFSPGLFVDESKVLDELALDGDTIDNVTNTAEIGLPSTTVSTSVATQPLVRIAGYAWNGQSSMIVANGGPRTTQGSLMESNGVNLEIVRQDWLSGLRDMQMKFIEQYDAGQEYPSSDKAAFAIMIMGDGAPFYISTMQHALNEKFGVDKYHVQVIGAIGMSDGEDKLIGPAEWKTNPQSMIGSLISVVLGDGDWVTALNYCFANGLPVNPDVTTYDPDAVNFLPSADDDYINSAKELIASQLEGYTIQLKEVKNGKLTGETINKKVDGCATWTPGDKMVFDALTGFTDVASTREFSNQMATTIIAVKEWAVGHDKIVNNILKSAWTASNQMKQYDSWSVRASEAVAQTYDLETPKYWYDMFKGQVGEKGGVTYNMGGTRVLTYADAMQYYGITDGTNRYKSVYNQVSTYLTQLNPFGFNESVKGVVPYEDAVNLYFLKSINDIETGVVETVDYTEERTEELASGQWHINFNTGSSTINETTSASDLQTIYNLLIQAENTRLTVIGHTDASGNDDLNMQLSKDRANSVFLYLTQMGIPATRFQYVDGKGETDPIANNGTNAGMAQNRRVEITFLQ